MKRSDLHLFLCAACACACASCNDDGAAAADGVTCADSAQCAENQVCVGGKCKPPADLGESCNADADCAGDYACRQEKCVAIVSKGNACGGAQTACADSLSCIGGICAAELSQGMSCTPNAPADVCADGLKCIARVCVQVAQIGEKCTQGVTQCETGATCSNGICKKQEISNPSCASADDCPESKPECHENGYCVKYAERNAYCDESQPCKPGLECYYYACAQYAEPGGPCDDGANILCDAGHYCSDGKCEKIEFSLQKGETCNGIYLFCGKGLDCREGICSQIVRENEACDEAQHIFCQDGNLACHNNVCAPISGDCQTSSDCAEKDSYCCTDDSCGAVKNKCVVYDEKTTYDESCKYETKPGIFEAQIQCRWQPAANDYPNAKAAEMPPLVGHFGNKDNVATTVVILSTPNRDGSSGNVLRVINAETCETLESIPGNGFHKPAWDNYPAAADLDNDGWMEILVARSGNKHIQAFKWNAEQKKHEVWWESEISAIGNIMVFDVNGDGLPEVLNGTTVVNGQTGKTIVAGSYSGSKTLAIGYLDNDPDGYASMLTGQSLVKWNGANNRWDTLAEFPYAQYHAGYADFGTPGETAADFDFLKLDGKPEFVFAGNSALRIYAAKLDADGNYVFNGKGRYEIQEIMSVKNFNLGGPVTIGDFDNDGLPEVAVASKNAFGVYDPRCKGYNNPEGSGCADDSVLWERWSQDVSSGVTGSSLFDFDGDGQPEAVYGDECFVRVYEGNTGRILFSAKRSSYTSYEAPVIADADGDGSAEILMTSDRPYRSCYDDTTPAGWEETDGEDLKYKPRNSTDPIHEGIRCVDDEDCPTSKNCNKTIGLCLCESDSDCNTQYIKRDGQDVLFEQYKCMEPLHPQVGFYTYSEKDKKRVQAVPKGTRPEGWKDGDYKVCRASRKLTDYGNEDLVIYKDRLDRWVSSRSIWNQHAYNIINIEDDGSLPSRAAWWGNWIREKLDQYINGTQQRRRAYNSYRLNKQGLYGAGTVPDITGRFETDSICGKTYAKHPDESCTENADCAGNRVCREGVCADMRYVIGGKLCNRGTKPVSKNLPASFYFYDETKENNRGERICTSYTKTPVGIGQCDKVGCEVTKDVFDALIGKDVLMITNENEYGFRSTDECNYNNNNDRIRIDACAEDIVIVN